MIEDGRWRIRNCSPLSSISYLQLLSEHLAHHRGQLTVYLRLNDRPVPSIYGPTADDQRFA